MSDTVTKHILRYPNCRPSTIAYLRTREETTKKLMKEIHEEQLRRTPRPWWKRLRDTLAGRV